MGRPWLAHYPPGVAADVDTSAVPTLVHLFDQAAAAHGARDQAVFLGRAYTYARLDAAGRAFAAWLAQQGIGPGARVAIMLPNVPQYFPAVTGVLRAGATVVGVNPLYTARELRAQLDDAQVSAIVVLENFAATLQEATAGGPPVTALVAGVGDWLGPVKGPLANFVLRHVRRAVRPWSLPGALRFDRALATGARAPFTPPAIAPADVALVQYTGGTTGVSKGAMITHANAVAAVVSSGQWLEPALAREPRVANPVVVCALPLYHIYALVACFLLAARIGAKSLLVPNPRDLDALVRDLARDPPHLFPAVNTLYNALLDHPGFGRIDFTRLRVANSGGMAVQRSVAEWNGSVGLPFPGCDIDLRDRAGHAVPLGEAGEVVVRGPQVMAGYWRRPEETARAFTADGWLRTGDIGVMDAKGELRIVDRKKDMIIVSGFNVYPNEIEAVATLHPGVSEAAAIGVPDARSGEAVKLFVVRRDPALTERALADFLAGQLTNYKRPRHYAFVEALPKTPVGKILRRALREDG